MRELKFKSWNKILKQMGNPWDIKVAIEWGGGNPISSYDSYIQLQYTGLKDKNGVEIYEGDIIRDTYVYSPEFSGRQIEKQDVFEVTIIGLWERHIDLNTEVSFESMKEYYSSSDEETGCEIIGNIYENPELIEKNNHA